MTSILKLTSPTGPFSREAEEQQRLLQKMNEAKLLVIDGFDWKKKLGNDIHSLLVMDILDIVRSNKGVASMYILLERFLSTDLQKKNLNLVINPAYGALQEFIREGN